VDVHRNFGPFELGCAAPKLTALMLLVEMQGEAPLLEADRCPHRGSVQCFADHPGRDRLVRSTRVRQSVHPLQQQRHGSENLSVFAKPHADLQALDLGQQDRPWAGSAAAEQVGRLVVRGGGLLRRGVGQQQVHQVSRGGRRAPEVAGRTRLRHHLAQLRDAFRRVELAAFPALDRLDRPPSLRIRLGSGAAEIGHDLPDRGGGLLPDGDLADREREVGPTAADQVGCGRQGSAGDDARGSGLGAAFVLDGVHDQG
jgi:hypothetical protein